MNQFTTYKLAPLPLDYNSNGFLYGFIVGQVTIFLIVAVFLRFFLFSTSQKTTRNKNPQVQYSQPIDDTPINNSLILSKTSYNLHHLPESLDWFNVILAQIINQYRADAQNSRLMTWLNTVLNGQKRPDILDEIKITELNIGEDFPIFSNCKIQKVGQSSGRDAGDNLVAEMDVDLSDTITLGIETRVLLNQPKWLNISMPVSLTLSIVRFSARLRIRMLRTHEEANEKNTKLSLYLSFKPDFTLEVATRSLLGARSRLQDMPRIGHIIEGFFRKWFLDNFVEPYYREFIIMRYNISKTT